MVCRSVESLRFEVSRFSFCPMDMKVIDQCSDFMFIPVGLFPVMCHDNKSVLKTEIGDCKKSSCPLSLSLSSGSHFFTVVQSSMKINQSPPAVGRKGQSGTLIVLVTSGNSQSSCSR